MGKAIICNLGQSRSFGRLSLKAKVLWPMLLVSADDQGRGDAASDVVKWYICPNVDEITRDDIPGIFAEMVEQGMVLVYQDGEGEQLFQIVQWWRYQNPQWAQPSKYPAPEGWMDRERYNVRGGDYVETNWDQPGGFTESEPVGELVDFPGGNTGGNPPGLPKEDKLRQEKSGKTKGGNKTPPAIKVFRENAHRYPAKSWYTEVDDVVGRSPPDLELWGKVVKAYVGNGWNPTNVRNMLDFFKRREIPPPAKGKGKGNGQQGDYADIDFGDA